LSSDVTSTLLKITILVEVFYLLGGILRNDDGQFFPELMMYLEATATFMPNEIAIQ